MGLIVGDVADLSGNITQLKAIGAKAPHDVETSLGYHQGRLSRGYWICLLMGPLLPADFELAGTTLRSGGKLGAPAATQSADARRQRVHDAILADYGAPGYGKLQELRLSSVTNKGADRIAKVVPQMRHMKHASPAKQYPMGGGHLQWDLPQSKPFFIAAFVDAQGVAQTPSFRVRIDPAAPYDGRAQLRRYLEQAP